MAEENRIEVFLGIADQQPAVMNTASNGHDVWSSKAHRVR